MKTKSHASEFVNVATFNHLPEAEALKSLLLGEGITARVQDETNLQKYWFWAAAKAGIHVQVGNECTEKAQKILSQPEAALRAIPCKSSILICREKASCPP